MPTLFLASDKLASMLIWIALVIPVAIATWLLHQGRVQSGQRGFHHRCVAAADRLDLALRRIDQPHRELVYLDRDHRRSAAGGTRRLCGSRLDILTLTVLLILTEANVIPPPSTPNKPADIWANVCIGIGLGAALLYLTTNSINQALTTARRNAAALQQSNRELNAIRASLEDRVAERTAQLNVSAEVAQAVSSILGPE